MNRRFEVAFRLSLMCLIYISNIAARLTLILLGKANANSVMVAKFKLESKVVIAVDW